MITKQFLQTSDTAVNHNNGQSSTKILHENHTLVHASLRQFFVVASATDEIPAFSDGSAVNLPPPLGVSSSFRCSNNTASERKLAARGGLPKRLQRNRATTKINGLKGTRYQSLIKLIAFPEYLSLSLNLRSYETIF